MVQVILILLCLLSSIVGFSASSPSECLQKHCLAVVDAGSTGSRLHIYAYDLADDHTPIHINHVWSNKVTPGLASIDPKHIDAYFTMLFANAPKQTLPVYVYATAGMRLISQPIQQQYFTAIQQWFTQHTQWMLQDAKTITGKQEGLYGWLALNYALGRLQSDDKPLVNVMDMGGASVQLAMPVENMNAINPNDLVHLSIYNRHIALFVHSFLGLGQTEVSHHYLDTPHCFPYEYTLPSESMGQGDAQACQQDVSKLINSVHDVNDYINPIVRANAKTETMWYATSGLGSLVKNKPFEFQDNQFTSHDMLQIADNKYCHAPWSELSHQPWYNKYTAIGCLSASYYYGLLINGYGLQPTDVIHFMPDNDEPDWTLGVLISRKTLDFGLH